MALQIQAGASWQTGYRPTHVRVTYACDSPPMSSLAVGKYAGGNDYGLQDYYVSGAEMELTCTDDIERINLYGGCGNFQVTKIEFYV
jgi:hypothetical protein